MLDLLLVAAWLTINMLWVYLTVLPKINNINSKPEILKLSTHLKTLRECSNSWLRSRLL